MGVLVEVKYFNSFWLKKVCKLPDPVDAPILLPGWPGLPWNPSGYPKFPFGDSSTPGEWAPVGNQGDENAYQEPWFVEEMRIKGGFNNTPIDLGVKAYIVEERKNQERLSSSLIYSGVFNSRTGVNDTNVFSVGQDITKSVDPINGSIQKLYAEDTNLMIFQENKVQRALIDKDAVYTAEGSAMQTQSNVVIGQIVPYLGEYGISTNPESFAIYGFQKYFADRNRGCILRLSRDGLTEISRYGMVDYFRDELASISDDWLEVSILGSMGAGPTGWGDNWISVNDQNISCCDITIGSSVAFEDVNGNFIDSGLFVEEATEYNNGVDIVCAVKLSGVPDNKYYTVKFINNVKSQILGGWDIHNKSYVVSMQNVSKVHDNHSITPKIDGEAGDYSTVSFDESLNGWTSFHHYKPAFIGSLKNKYYSFYDGKLYEHYFNSNQDDNRGIYYDLDRAESSISFVFNPSPSVSKNFKTLAYEGSNGWEGEYFVSGYTGKDSLNTNWVQNQDKIGVVYSYEEGLYTDPRTGYPTRAGFDRKENLYTTNIIDTSTPRPGEVIITGMTGIKGYFATVKFKTDSTTDPGGMKELYSVSSEFVLSSY